MVEPPCNSPLCPTTIPVAGTIVKSRSWRLTAPLRVYHHEVTDDLEALGRYQARAVLRTIEIRIRDGEPDKTGKPLSGELAGCRRIRTGDVRIVYRVHAGIVEVLIVAVGPRRNDEVYRTVRRRA